jgi:predicted DNA-binding antitoxin AbrB/MazE fold protein
MQKTFEAVYEDGVLRPLETLMLADREHVQVTISSIADPEDDVALFFPPEEWEASKTDNITLEEVRNALSSIKGSLAQAAIDSREERF